MSLQAIPFDRLASFFRRRWPHLEEAKDPEKRRLEFRLRVVERDFGLPVKLAVLAVLVYYLFFSNWVDDPSNISSTRDAALATVRLFCILYTIFSLGTGIILAGMRQLPLWFNQLVVLAVAIVDVLFLAALTLVTGGFDSALYWLFLILITRNALSIPAAATQITVNLLVVFCYFMSGLTDLALARIDPAENVEGATEPFFLRIVVLTLIALCCYGVQALFDRQRHAEEEAREYSIRQEQLQATGRLAAEIAHQLKNPLGIINNAAFTLQRTVKEGKTITQQIHIIREEVDRSDRIITDLMGFAKLAEGTVEAISIPDHLDKAIKEAFPPAVKYDVSIHRDYAPALPQVFMQRGHFSEIMLNILQNAREAMNGVGNIKVSAHYGDDYSVIVTVEDDGPGIPPEKLEQIFEPYFTTKEKGTGLGLAIVKHNVEIYGGLLSVESEYGRGTKFYLQFPARTLMKLRK